MPIGMSKAANAIRLPLPRQKLPQLANGNPLHRQHAILQTVKVLAMDRRHKLARNETEEDAGRDVVFP